MKKFHDLLTETSLSRVFRHFNNKEIPVLLMSAFRGEYTKKENLARNKNLAGQLKKAGYGYVFVDGVYTENKDTPNEVEVAEDSILCFGNVKDNGKLKGLGKKFLKQFSQEGIIFKEENSLDVQFIFANGSSDNLGPFTTKKLEQGFTKLRNRKGGKEYTKKDGLKSKKKRDIVFAFESARFPMNFYSRMSLYRK